MRTVAIAFEAYAGPSMHAPFAAVAAVLTDVPDTRLPAARVTSALGALLPPARRARLLPPALPAAVEFVDLVARLAAALQDFHGAIARPCAIARGDGDVRVLLGYRDARAATRALETACALVSALWQAADGVAIDVPAQAALLRRALGVLHRLHPDDVTRMLMLAADARGIPVYPVTSTRVWQYGQGSAGCQYFEAATQDDSLIGARLARDKLASNELITRLGLPGVEHYLARNEHEARVAAARLGYPLVVKPLAGTHGRGVTTGIADEAALCAAFVRAGGAADGVLVERQVAGRDYRISVIGGRYTWCVWRRAPRVTGDGLRTVSDLIEAENLRRAGADLEAGRIKRLVLDEDMRAVLARQGLAPDGIPAAGREIMLRSVHNTSAGGLPLDVSDTVHPDNRALVETLARVFRLPTCGVDFISPDVGRSWREVECAVIELNSTPGFSHVDRAEKILAQRFPPPARGRIPSALLVDQAGVEAEAVATLLAARGLRVGLVGRASCTLAGEPRRLGRHTLAERVLALLLDPALDALLVCAGADELGAHGLPLDHFTCAALPGPPATPLDALVVRHATRLCAVGCTPEPARALAAAMLESPPP